MINYINNWRKQMDYTIKQLQELLGLECFNLFERMNNYLLDNYNVKIIWEDGGKYGKTCLRYRRSSKTLCTIYFRDKELGLWIIFGKEEQRVFAERRNDFSLFVRNKYDNTKVYHDGKWLMFNLVNDDFFDDIVKLLNIKIKPNRKLTMCGYCCDMCKAYVKNVEKMDEREVLAKYWHKYYDLNVNPERINCDGCRCNKADAHRIDNTCPVRACVMSKKLNDCSDCNEYPCDIFMSRKGLSLYEANDIQELSIKDYIEYLSAFDNKSRLDRKLKR